MAGLGAICAVLVVVLLFFRSRDVFAKGADLIKRNRSLSFAGWGKLPTSSLDKNDENDGDDETGHAEKRALLGGSKLISDRLTHKLSGGCVQPVPEPTVCKKVRTHGLMPLMAVGRSEATESSGGEEDWRGAGDVEMKSFEGKDQEII